MSQRTLPAGFIAPCLPTKTNKLPSGSQWLHEIKHDGFRVIARKDGRDCGAIVVRATISPVASRGTVGVPVSEHDDADSRSLAISDVGSEKEGRMALDGMVLMVDVFFRQWDYTEKMWSEYERAGFRLVVIGGELRLSELSPIERMKYRCKHRRLVERWRDMRLEGSKFDGVADASALDEGRKLGLFEDMVEDVGDTGGANF
jgi:hypothetical protein